MDDYSINSLTESKNEWCARLVSILSHNIIQGINSIYDEAVKLCIENEEDNKYLMTFQNLLSRIPEWNPNTIETERKRIEAVSGCKYLEDLISCVHIIQLKALTCIRVGLKQKKIDIDIPSIDKFVHRIYINTARKLYTNIYLFEKDIYPLQIQKNNRELELLVKEAILTTIRDNIPVEQILRVYMEETEEQEVEPIKVENTLVDASNNAMASSDSATSTTTATATTTIETNAATTEEKLAALAEKISANDDSNIENESLSLNKSGEKVSIDFSNIDSVIDSDNSEINVDAPKDLETLERKAAIYNEHRAIEAAEEAAEDEENIKLSIGDDVQVHMDAINLSDSLNLDNDPILDDIEVI